MVQRTHQINFIGKVGYTASSVSKSNIESVKNYIEHHKEHHHNINKEEEFIAILKALGSG